MTKKTYSLEFTYTDENEEIKVLEVNNYDYKNKDSVIRDNINNLVKLGAVNIVVKETCIYKIL